MKTKCLDDFFKSLESEISKEYADSIRKLIDNNNLNEKTLSELVIKEVGK